MVLSGPNPIRARVRQSALIHEEGGVSVLKFHAMGTVCAVTLVEPTRAAANAYLDRLLDWVADFEARYSRFIDSSLICRINNAAGREWVPIDEETQGILSLCHQMVFLTQGAFDPTALPLIRLWNWKASPAVVPDDAQIQRTRELVGWGRVAIRPGAVFLTQPGMCLDLGGIGKEYAVDAAVAMASEYGVEHVLVDFGQDIRASGRSPGRPAWHVGLEDPKAPGTCWGSVAVTDAAVASSGDYLRHFMHGGRRYGHIIDPRTGYPVNNGCRSVTVIASSSTLAGILSTSAFVLGPKDGLDRIHSTFGAAGAIYTETSRLTTPRFHEYLVQTL